MTSEVALNKLKVEKSEVHVVEVRGHLGTFESRQEPDRKDGSCLQNQSENDVEYEVKNRRAYSITPLLADFNGILKNRNE